MIAARTFHALAWVALATAYTASAIRPVELPARYHNPGRVAALSAYYGLAGAGPGTVGRL